MNYSVLRPFFLGAICIILNGCAGAWLARDSSELSGGYAKATNQQLLLNLARLRNDDPPYFLQLSSITTQDTLSNATTFSPSNANTTLPGGSTWTLGGSTAQTTAQNPTFTFVPLNGDPYSNAISVPISVNLYYTFIRQGLPADLVSRIMLSSVDVPTKKILGTASIVVDAATGKMKMPNNKAQLENPSYSTADTNPDYAAVTDKSGNYVNDLGKPIFDSTGTPIAGAPKGLLVPIYSQGTYSMVNNPTARSYNDFLTWCYNVRLLQKYNLLTIKNMPGTVDSPGYSYTISDLRLADLVAAKSAGYEVKPTGGNNYTVQKAGSASFSFGFSVDPTTPDIGKVQDEAKYSSEFQGLFATTFHVNNFPNKIRLLGEGTGAAQPYNSAAAVNTLTATDFSQQMSLNVLAISTESSSFVTPRPAVQDAKDTLPSKYGLNTRTFLATLRGLAKEEPYFGSTDAAKHTLSIQQGSKSRTVEKVATPVLTLVGPNTSDSDYNLLICQSYRGTFYYIGDRVAPDQTHDFFDQGNRQAFSILTLLFADVAFDPSKLQQPVQIIP